MLKKNNPEIYSPAWEPGRFRWLLAPIRRFLVRLLGPYFQKHVESADRAHAEIGKFETQITKIEKTLNAMGLDQMALARRLAALEDHLEASERREQKVIRNRPEAR